MELILRLQDIGLPASEAKVYLALLDVGSATAGILAKKSEVNRTNVYDALEGLIKKGMVRYVIKANRRYFEAHAAERMLKYLGEKEAEVQKKKHLLTTLLPELEARRKLTKDPQEAVVYKGKEGLKSIAEDVLKTKKELFVFGAEGRFMELFKHYAEQWHIRRGTLKIPITIIFNEKVRAKKAHAHFPRSRIRFNAALYETPATTWIYGEKAAIIVWSDQPIATLIRSNAVAQSYKQCFEVLWKNSSK